MDELKYRLLKWISIEIIAFTSAIRNAYPPGQPLIYQSSLKIPVQTTLKKYILKSIRIELHTIKGVANRRKRRGGKSNTNRRSIRTSRNQQVSRGLSEPIRALETTRSSLYIYYTLVNLRKRGGGKSKYVNQSISLA